MEIELGMHPNPPSKYTIWLMTSDRFRDRIKIAVAKDVVFLSQLRFASEGQVCSVRSKVNLARDFFSSMVGSSMIRVDSTSPQSHTGPSFHWRRPWDKKHPLLVCTSVLRSST